MDQRFHEYFRLYGTGPPAVLDYMYALWCHLSSWKQTSRFAQDRPVQFPRQVAGRVLNMPAGSPLSEEPQPKTGSGMLQPTVALHPFFPA